MSDDIQRVLEEHSRFEEAEDAFALTGTTFEARVTVEGDLVRVEATVPTLDAAVADETVAPVVEDGWFETFERRVRNVGGVTRAKTAVVTRVERTDSTVSVVIDLRTSSENVGEDVVAAVSFVEGTWMEGIIPGYDYVDQVQQLRDRASQNAQSS